MAYPHDGTPNLRPGAEQEPTARARRYDPELELDALFDDFLADFAACTARGTGRRRRRQQGRRASHPVPLYYPLAAGYGRYSRS
jgi:hypothetical protein